MKIVLCRDLKRAFTTEAHFPKSEIFTNKFFKIFRGVHFFCLLGFNEMVRLNARL